MLRRTALALLLPWLLAGPVVAGADGAPAPVPAELPAVMELSVDATAAPRRLLRARLSIPTAPGPLTLAYPKWLPGTHGPTGDITSLVGLRFTAGGKTLAWRRDDQEMYAFHLEVPAGAQGVEAELEFLSAIPGGGFTQPVSFSPELGILRWHEVLLYPAGTEPDRLQVRASVRFPAGWRYGTALAEEAGTSGDGAARFAPVSLTTLVDSPVLAGRHLRVIPLDPGTRPVDLVVAADTPAALELPQVHLDFLKALVRETDALFGARHFDRYRFLVALSDTITHFGLEHHESSQNRMPERSFTDPVLARLWLDLLAHEYAHSWNGKHRRPAGLATADFHAPMVGELLWVYEGLTQYLGQTLAMRSGLWTPERYRDQLAQAAAWYSIQPGRAWRPLLDTAVATQRYGSAPAPWSSYRRSLDYYNEGWLVWLEADIRIRELTRGRRSLDDFLRAFAGPPAGPRQVRSFTGADIYAGLAAVAPADWQAFFRERLETAGARAPVGGIDAGGWELHFDGHPNQHLQDIAGGDAPQVTDLSFSLGLRLLPDGLVQDVLRGSSAETAGFTPGLKILAVNQRRYSAPLLKEAVTRATAGEGLEFLTENGDFYGQITVPYRGGLREPHLRRRPGTRDWLSQQLAPRTQ